MAIRAHVIRAKFLINIINLIILFLQLVLHLHFYIHAKQTNGHYLAKCQKNYAMKKMETKKKRG